MQSSNLQLELMKGAKLQPDPSQAEINFLGLSFLKFIYF